MSSASQKTLVELSAVGRGSYGQVWKCYNSNKKRHVVLKKIEHNTHDDGKTTIDASTIREIAAYAKASTHPNLLVYFDTHVNAKDVCLELEFIPGMTLREYQIKLSDLEQKMDEYYIHGLVQQLCSAVTHLHKKEIAHRDIKPENILLHNDMLKLIDFGLSCTETDMQGPDYCTTRWYRPPELVCFTSNQKIDPFKVDLWSIGVIITELYYNRGLFLGGDEDWMTYYFVKFLGYPPETVPYYDTFVSMTKKLEKEYKLCIKKENKFPACGIFTNMVRDELLLYDPSMRVLFGAEPDMHLLEKYKQNTPQKFVLEVQKVCKRVEKKNVQLFMKKYYYNQDVHIPDEQFILETLSKKGFWSTWFGTKQSKKNPVKRRCMCVLCI